MVEGKIADGSVRITKGHHIRKGRSSWTRFPNVKEKVKQKENLVILTYPMKRVHVHMYMFFLNQYISTVTGKNYAVLTTETPCI